MDRVNMNEFNYFLKIRKYNFCLSNILQGSDPVKTVKPPKSYPANYNKRL